jgi:2-hydroxychromene-2-carboxylate isomerase
MDHCVTSILVGGIIDKIVDYYFSPSSPWTYLGHGRLVALAAEHGARVNVKPVDLAHGVFPISGGLPVAKRPKQRIAYRSVELKRWSHHLGIPLNLTPRFFPVASDLAARSIVSADNARGANTALDFAGRIMTSVWTEEGNIADPDTLMRIASASGLDGRALLSSADIDEVKDRYAQYTREAIERQVFGAPFYIYRDEPFWGQDRLDFLERALSAS